VLAAAARRIVPFLLGAAVAGCAALGGGEPAPRPLAAEEQKLIAYVAAHNDEAIRLIERAVNIESPTEDLAGVKRVGLLFKKEFEALGMKARWIDMPPAMKRAGHLIATTHGTKGQRLLLLGHIDTVLRGEKFRREGDKAYGTGTSDMKAGVVVMLQALKALHAAGALQDARITVLLTGDEEKTGRPIEVGRGDMVAAARASDIALSFEAAVGATATVGRRGSSYWTLEVEAATGHSSRIFQPDMGSGANFEAARILTALHESLRGEQYLTFNPSVFVGGTEARLDGVQGAAHGKANVIAARAIVHGDLRFISDAQKERARAKMREIVARSLPGTTARIAFEDGLPAMTPAGGNYALLAQLNEVSRDLGQGRVEALDPSERGAGDIAFVSDLLPSLDGIGCGSGGNSHAPGEWMELGSLPALTQRAAVFLYRLTRAN
jgi:glutamate carboxypeptidase